MNKLVTLIACALLSLPALASDDAAYAQALKNFRDQPATKPFFDNSVGYAVFPTVGKGGIGVGGAFGVGRLYRDGAYVADIKMAQLSVGLQLGGQAYSEIIFFKNADTFNEFSGGSFELAADASAVALTAGAQASASTSGTTASMGTSAENTTESVGAWVRGMAVFTLAKGGLMYQASIGGQAFDVSPIGK